MTKGCALLVRFRYATTLLSYVVSVAMSVQYIWTLVFNKYTKFHIYRHTHELIDTVLEHSFVCVVA